MNGFVKRKKALKMVRDHANADPMVIFGKKEGVFRIDRYVSPTLIIRTDISMVINGFRIESQVGIPVKDEQRSAVMEKMNALNNENIRGKYVIDDQNHLCYRNFMPCDEYVDFNVFMNEIVLGNKMFLTDMAEIITALGVEEKGTEEFHIV